jgi:four helix bundle protein
MDSPLKDRTKQYAIRVIRVYIALPKSTLGQVLGKQLLRAGTSVGAQYREALHARSRSEFASKIESALQELEESSYWLELIMEFGLLPEKRLTGLLTETGELRAMAIASLQTLRPARPASSSRVSG